MILVVMAAGMGSRYGGLKQMESMNSAGEFLLDYSVYDAIQAGYNKVIFIIKEENYGLFRQTAGKRIEKYIKTEYVFQKMSSYLPKEADLPADRVKPLGTGHAVLCASERIDDNFTVINADDFYGRASFKAIAEYMKNTGKAEFCMSGFHIGNTLSENGHVSRGVCELDENGMLLDVTERTKIVKTADGASYIDENEVYHPLAQNTVVSMNCWGFTPAFLPKLKEYFEDFIKNQIPSNPLKAEFYLPAAVKNMMDDKLCTVKVLPTAAKWYGVTYKEDLAMVKNAIAEFIQNGSYPEVLFR